MAHKWKKYGEGRLYLVASSVGALAIVSSVLYAQDRAAFSPAQERSAPVVVEAGQSAPPASSRARAVTVHTRTRAS